MSKRLAYLTSAVFILIFGLILIASISSVIAQDALPTLPPIDAPPTFTPDPMLATLPPAPDSGGVPGIAPTPVLDDRSRAVLEAARSDTEALATDRLGEGRPEGWHGVVDVTNADYAILLRLDLESLADALLGAGVRPQDWVGVVQSVPLAFSRDIRHDLEILADVVIGASTIRPGGWRGDDPVLRCDRTAINLLFILEREYEFVMNIDWSQPNYCTQFVNAVNGYVEYTLIQPPVPLVEVRDYLVESPYVIGFADINARGQFGVLPVGTDFTPVGRSSSEFSNMMLIEGSGFVVYVDHTYTPVTAEEFAELPVIDPAVVTTACSAEWCE